MKILIQHNWGTGLGDFYCAATEYTNFVNFFKEKGFKTELILSFNPPIENKFIGFTEFEKIFDINSFKVFDDISVRRYTIKDQTIGDLKYIATQYGPGPGQHWWDIYLDEKPMDYPMTPNYNTDRVIEIAGQGQINTSKPNILPKFNHEVYTKCDKFFTKIPEDCQFLHIRYVDWHRRETQELKNIVRDLKTFIINKGGNFHVGTNNQYILESLAKIDNAHTYEYSNINILPNDHTYYWFNKHISDEILLDRLYDNLAEMVSLTRPKKFYQLSILGWHSNFLYYGLINRSTEFEFERIHLNYPIDKE
jgi:hypothetical protein